MTKSAENQHGGRLPLFDLADEFRRQRLPRGLDPQLEMFADVDEYDDEGPCRVCRL